MRISAREPGPAGHGGDLLKITFFACTGTSLGVRITNLSPGKLTYRIVGTKVTGTATVETKVALQA